MTFEEKYQGKIITDGNTVRVLIREEKGYIIYIYQTADKKWELAERLFTTKIKMMFTCGKFLGTKEIKKYLNETPS